MDYFQRKPSSYKITWTTMFLIAYFETLLAYRRHLSFIRIYQTFFIFIVSSFLPHITIQGQNIIVDGSFENLKDDRCSAPDQSFVRLSDWYILDATPDLFVSRCPFDETEFIFWDKDTEPYEGSNYVGLWSRWNSNGTYFSEAIASRFLAPLIANQSYLFQIAIENRGGFQGLDGSVTGCSLMPLKHIDLYLSTDSIQIENNFSNGTSSTTAQLVASLNSESITGSSSDGWVIVSTCFTANGGEEFFGMTMPLGTFGALPPCASTANSGVFRSFYYHLDAASVTLLPERFSTKVEKCPDGPLELDLVKLYEYDFLDGTSFKWNDGYEGAVRTITESKEFIIEAELICGSIMLDLQIEELDCSVGIYVPNAFSPNEDGQNDTFIISMTNEIVVNNFQLTIFDRWGGVIHQGNNMDVSWDGKADGQYVNPGVYSWFLSFDTDTLEGNLPSTKTGQVLVIR